MTRSITPEIVVTDNSTDETVTYTPTVTQSQTPAVTNVIASTSLTVTYNP